MIYDMAKKTVVYQNMIDVSVSVPYHAGFLSYREMDVYRQLMDTLKQDHPDFVPQIILVDGQGRLHPRHFGSACCVGLEFGIPTIGVGKNPFCGAEFIREKCESGGNANSQTKEQIHNARVGGVDVCLDTKKFKSLLDTDDVYSLSGSDP